MRRVLFFLILFIAIQSAHSQERSRTPTLNDILGDDAVRNIYRHLNQRQDWGDRQRRVTNPHLGRENEFSYWGYRHSEIHKLDIVRKMFELTKKTCCDGPHSGECRVAKVSLPERLAYVNGQWCEMEDATQIIPIAEVEQLTEGNEPTAVVCASPTVNPRGCATIYCVATRPPRT